jgi:AcrR family transcriptional regulator
MFAQAQAATNRARSGAPPRRRLPRPERERQILDAAHVLFAARGFGAVTMDDVAAEVGVTKPLLYAYFGNKEQLYISCMKRPGDTLLQTVVDAVAAAPRPAEMLRCGVEAFFAFLAEDRQAWRVLFDETLPASGEVAARVNEYRERLLGLIVQAQLQRVPEERRESAEVQVQALAHALLGACEALARWWLHTGAISTAAAADLLITTVEPGLREQWAGANQPTPIPDTKEAR